MNGLTAWDLVASFAITWLIGLTPPVLIRYVVLRRAIQKPTAIFVSGIFYVGNLALFIMLGSQSRSHAALFLVAWVSYTILIRPPREVPLSTPRSQPVIETVPEATMREPADVAEPSSPSRQWWTLGRRRVVAWAVVAGAMLGVISVGYFYVDEWQSKIKSLSASSTYEAQAAGVISRHERRARIGLLNRSEPDSPADLQGIYRRLMDDELMKSEPDSQQCVAWARWALKGLAADRQSAFVNAAAACRFAKPASGSVFDYPQYVASMAVVPLLGAFGGAVVALLWLWPLSYPHPGWRRVATVAGPATFLLVIAVGFMQESLDDGPEVWIIALLAGCLAPGVTVSAVRLSQWVRAGFETSARP